MNTIVLILLCALFCTVFISIFGIISTIFDAILLRYYRNKQYKSMSWYEKYTKDHILTYYWDNVKKAQSEKQANINFENELGKFIFKEN